MRHLILVGGLNPIFSICSSCVVLTLGHAPAEAAPSLPLTISHGNLFGSPCRLRTPVGAEKLQNRQGAVGPSRQSHAA